jgi:hypothetical protein
MKMSETTMTDTPAESTSTDSADVSQEVVSSPVVESEGSDVWNDEEFNMNEPLVPTEKPVEDTVVDADWDGMYKTQIDSESGLALDKPILLKHKGKVLEIKDAKDLRDLAERGLGATSKFQEMAEQRKMLDGITGEDIDLLRRARDGDAEAMNQLVSKQNVSPEEVQKQQYVEQSEQIATEIIGSDYADQFKEALGLFPESQRYEVATNPRFMGGLKQDFDKGIAQKLMPSVQKYMAVDGMEFIEAYARAGKEVLGGGRSKKAEKLSSAPSASSSVQREEPVDIWEMDSDQFSRIMGSTRN